MVSSWDDSGPSTPEPVPEVTSSPRGEDVTQVPVRGEEQERLVCPEKFCGSEDSEYWEDYWRSIVMPRRLIDISNSFQTNIYNRYHHFYLAAKGNQYKNKKVLIEAIHVAKAEKLRIDKQEQEAQ